MTAPAPPAVGKLSLDPHTVARARALAARVGRPVVELARSHTTVSVERATLRLAGLDGADSEGIPWVNRLVDTVADSVGLEHGVCLPVWDALRTGPYRDLTDLAAHAAARTVRFRVPRGEDAEAAAAAAHHAVARGLAVIDARRAERDRLVGEWGDPPAPGSI